MKHGMDYLIFLDDDEYPLAVTKSRQTAIWSGQHILSCHLRAIVKADITYGHHCGYISPIPSITFNDLLDEETFRIFIEAISNDIVTWETTRKVMANGGVTYASTAVLTSEDAVEVEEVNHAKFISGSNLCINLTQPERVFPFYNPPNARGPQTFRKFLTERCARSTASFILLRKGEQREQHPPHPIGGARLNAFAYQSIRELLVMRPAPPPKRQPVLLRK